LRVSLASRNVRSGKPYYLPLFPHSGVDICTGSEIHQ
jgi:hypothetical protein